MLAEETQAFQIKCSQLRGDQAKSQEAKETVHVASSNSSDTLIEVMSREMLLPQDQLQELYRRLEQLKSQLTLPK
jgi:prefoldin subunit 5